MKKALIVGLNKYPNCELNWCDNDAIAMKQLLESNGDGSPNFDVKSIIDTCEKNILYDSIDQLFEGDADISLLYFSGHGDNSDGGYICTTDYNKNCLGMRMDDILMKANHSRCKNKVIILDCCYSAKMGESAVVNNNSVLGEGITIMTASQNWQESAEENKIGHGVFTNLLIQGLKGGAADIGGHITPASLYSFVDQSLGAWQQRPVFKTNISRFLTLRTVPAKVPKEILRKISHYFKSPTDEFKLDSSFEYTNDPQINHEIMEPYANPDNVAIFKDLQRFESVGIVEPVDEEHMYWAAIHGKSCRLTALGLHYWKLSHDKRF